MYNDDIYYWRRSSWKILYISDYSTCIVLLMPTIQSPELFVEYTFLDFLFPLRHKTDIKANISVDEKLSKDRALHAFMQMHFCHKWQRSICKLRRQPTQTKPFLSTQTWVVLLLFGWGTYKWCAGSNRATHHCQRHFWFAQHWKAFALNAVCLCARHPCVRVMAFSAARQLMRARPTNECSSVEMQWRCTF